MIKDILDKKINMVLVFKIDRLTRSIRDLVELVDIFNTNNCAFNSLMESIDTKTASGRMFLKIIGIFAEFERENIIERTTLGLEKKVKEGYTLSTGNASYGYDLEAGQKIQTINKKEAEIVKEIFNTYLNSNKSFSAIATELNLRGISSKKDSIWYVNTIQSILTNPNYIGKVRYGMHDESRYFEVEGHHEPIISQEIYDKVQLKISKIEKKSRTKRPKESYYYSGTLYCALCGRKLHTRNNHKILKDGTKQLIKGYRCEGKTKKVCSAKEMSHAKVDIAFLEYINILEDLEIPEDFTIEQEPIITENEAIKNDYEKELKQLEKKEYEKELKEFEKKEKEIMKLYISGKVDFEEYTKMVKIITSEIRNLQFILDNMVEEKTEKDILKNSDIITNIKENWEFLTNSERMEFLHNYVDRIYVENEPIENTC